ncbi:MAG: UDP-N-acetylmuramoyl-L-alanyl-D-glutamate--2,6-diaminopimelate ligase [Acidimicrobiales bacterium]
MTVRLASLLDDVDVLEVVGGDTGAVEVTAVTQDSQSVIAGSLYCCVPGSRVDGHDLAAAVVGAGARSLVVERWVDAAVPQVRVPSSRQAVAPIAAAFYGHPSQRLSVVGVTGTNGKTTTTHLLTAILRTGGRRTGLIGTLSGARTTPEAPALQARLAEFLDAGCEAVAMEVSSQALHQHRADAIDFAAAVWTNLSQDHLDYHGDMESYFAAKARLFERTRCRLAVVNGDDAWGRRLLSGLEVPFATYEIADAGPIVTGPEGTRFAWNGHAVTLPLAGAHNVSNALAAATTARALGVGDDVIAAGLSSAPPVPGRWERVDGGAPFGVVVDYAHTPDGLERALQAARGTVAPGGRVIVVFGCGGDRDRSKRPQMAGVAAALADVAILTSDNPRHEDPDAILAEATAGAPPGRLRIVADRDAAIGEAIAGAGPGDIVVVAGKGHETGQIVGDDVLPFDDREVAREHLDRRFGGGGSGRPRR